MKRKSREETTIYRRSMKADGEPGELKINRLSEFDNAMRSVIDGMEFTHSTILRILFRTNRFKINQSLRVLWMAGIIHRDIHGLVISTRATDNNPDLKAFIERSFKTHLT